jgi:type I restriction enzyme M protein
MDQVLIFPNKINTTEILDKLDQLFHNLGISKNLRHSELVKLVLVKLYDERTTKNLFYFDQSENLVFFEKRIKKLYENAIQVYDFPSEENILLKGNVLGQIVLFLQNYSLSIQDHSLMQSIFMKFGPQFLKMDMDQYFTPVEVVDFISQIMDFDDNSLIVDPAGGSGDFVVSAYKKLNSSIDLSNHFYYFDNSPDAKKVANLNFILNNLLDSELKTLDSISDLNSKNNSFDYVLTNPPFGTKTTWSRDLKIMESYTLAHKWNNNTFTNQIFRQQLGILFIEKSMQLLKEGGILAIVLPNGYLTNPSEKYIRSWLLTNYKVISVISLPAGTFKKSGTGVSSVILIVQKIKDETNYNIFTAVAKKIGFDFSGKLNEPLYKRNNINGEFILNSDGSKVPDNDLVEISVKFKYFSYKNKLNGFCKENLKCDYEQVNKNEVLKDPDLIISPKRYEKKYLDLLKQMSNDGALTLKEVGGKIIKKYIKPKFDKEYYYLDIGKVGKGIYIIDEKIPGWNLPGRAKQEAKYGDIFLSKLNGSSSKFCIILDKDIDIIVTNGMFKLSFNNIIQKYNFINFLNSSEFRIQFEALATGSIMEDIKESDLENKLLVPQKNIEQDSKKSQIMIDLLEKIKSIS